MGVILEPQTGKVLAMSSLPDFDPNGPATFPRETYRNRAVTDQFEPGSTFKVVLATAALSYNSVGKHEEFNCGDGSYNFRGHHVIEDWEKFSLLTFPQIIQNSSNVGTVKIAERIGPKNLYTIGRKFGFGLYQESPFPVKRKESSRRQKIGVVFPSLKFPSVMRCPSPPFRWHWPTALWLTAVSL